MRLYTSLIGHLFISNFTADFNIILANSWELQSKSELIAWTYISKRIKKWNNTMQTMQLMRFLPYLFLEQNIYISVKMNIKTYKTAFSFLFKN